MTRHYGLSHHRHYLTQPRQINWWGLAFYAAVALSGGIWYVAWLALRGVFS